MVDLLLQLAHFMLAYLHLTCEFREQPAMRGVRGVGKGMGRGRGEGRWGSQCSIRQHIHVAGPGQDHSGLI